MHEPLFVCGILEYNVTYDIPKDSMNLLIYLLLQLVYNMLIKQISV